MNTFPSFSGSHFQIFARGKECPGCGHRLPRADLRRLVTWRLSLRSRPCPHCARLVIWQRDAFLFVVAGILLGGVSAGLLFGALLAPWLAGFAEPSPSITFYQAIDSRPTPLRLLFLGLELLSLFIVLYGGLKSRIVLHEKP